MEAFWQWKNELVKKPSVQVKLGQVQAKFEHEIWNTDDMKAISDTSSEVYRNAVNSGLPEGLIRGLRSDLQEFKKLWRSDEY